MQRVLATSLSVLLLSGFSAMIAKAEINPAMAGSTPSQTTIRSISPNDLVSFAYQGAFRDQGIPGYASLAHAYAAQRITARDLVRVAIEVKKLPPETLSDTGYLNIVDTKLVDLNRS